jgi:glycosyltransferase involved in cell wall biosynthesis
VHFEGMVNLFEKRETSEKKRTSQMLPLVSVLMTAYNRESFIGEAIQSVLNSTFQNIELIVVDDCSTDKTLEIARHYAEQDPRVRVYVNERNLGDYPNRNRAASFATGEYLLYVDSDDILDRDGLQRCLETMQRFPASSFGIRYFIEEREPFELTSSAAVSHHFFRHPLLHIGPGGTIMKRSFFVKCGGYPESYGPANDMYFNLKVACHSSIVFIPFSFLFYRRHDGQEINNKYRYIYNNYLYLKDALKDLPLPLTSHQIKWLSKKNKRRFLVNVVNYFFQTRDLRRTQFLLKATSFRIGDVLQAVFH